MGTSIVMFSFLFLFCLIIPGDACRDSTQYSYHHTTAWQQYNANKKSKKSPPRDHWEVPETKTNEYGKWITQYTENRTKMGKGKTHEEASAEGSDASIKVGPDGIIPGLDIPTVWQGHGVGNGGQDPPPWAIIPYGLGKPSLCFMEPDKGYCAERKTRWGYNSYMADCRKFLYTGCGGNGNNFMTRKRCEESCVDERVSNCQKYGEYMEY